MTQAQFLEAGIGEGLTYMRVMKNLLEDKTDIKGAGFDLCWSRASNTKIRLSQHKIPINHLCTGYLENIPYLDNSFDAVYTAHAIEPNKGREKAILTELLRVTNKYLILIEPTNIKNDPLAKQRMNELSYCDNLIIEISKEMNLNIVHHEAISCLNHLNQSVLIVIEKNNKCRSS